MLQPHLPLADPITRMADGTIKQVNPFTGTEVWTVPGRGNRPLGVAPAAPAPLDPDRDGRHCAFCADRHWETPPEKARLVRSDEGWQILRDVPADALAHSVAEFRRVPNLFEIVTYEYWAQNYGYKLPQSVQERFDAYLSDPVGRQHAFSVLKSKLTASGLTDEVWATMSDAERVPMASSFFGGGHDVIIARRHFVDGATHDDQLASSGSLSPDEHAAYTAFTVDALGSIYRANRYVRYVSVFQNWLKPAGASFDHLHKQLVALDDRGVQTELELQRLRTEHNMYNEFAVDYAGYHNLVVMENEHAIAFAGFGHRYPSLEVYSKSATCRPFEQTPEEIRGMSDLLHACHAATGTHVPCNEEWHHQPIDVDLPMPWRIVLKWRVSTLAGFEGGTKIYLNTIDPWNLRDRVVPQLFRLRDEGLIARNIQIAEECSCRPNSLRYNPALR